MDQTDPETDESSKAALHPSDTSEARLVRITCRLMLLVNLLLAAYFCVMVVPGIAAFRDIFSGMGAALPAMTIIALGIPASAYWANIGGLAAVLLLLEVVGARPMVKLIANAVAIVLVVLAIILVELSMRLPLLSLVREV